MQQQRTPHIDARPAPGALRVVPSGSGSASDEFGELDEGGWHALELDVTDAAAVAAAAARDSAFADERAQITEAVAEALERAVLAQERALRRAVARRVVHVEEEARVL